MGITCSWQTLQTCNNIMRPCNRRAMCHMMNNINARHIMGIHHMNAKNTLLHPITVNIRKYTSDENEHASLTLDDKKRGDAKWYRKYAINVVFDFTNVNTVDMLVKCMLHPQSIMVKCQRELRDMSYVVLDAIIDAGEPTPFVVSLDAKSTSTTITPDANKRAVITYATDGTLSPDDIRKMITALSETLK